MRLRVIFVYTHDSIGLGEDGPTHQPIEHLASLRAIPHMDLWRPCDAVETAVAWGAAIENRDGPTCLIFTRQSVAHEARVPTQVAAISRGGYVLIDSAGTPEAIVIATGSEVGIAAEAVRSHAAKGRKVRLVSMPSTNTFDAQDDAYKQSVLPQSVTRRVAVEAGVDRALVALCRSTGRDRRHRSFRRLGAGQGFVQGLWLYGRACGRGDRESIGQVERIIFLIQGRGRFDPVKFGAKRLIGVSPDGNQGGDQRVRTHRPQYSASSV